MTMGAARLLTLADGLSALVTWVGRAAAWLAVPMMLVILADVVLRRYFVVGSVKLQELEWHLHGALFLLCLGYAYARDAHVRIELVHERFPPALKAWVELIGCAAFLLPYCGAILYFGVDYAWLAFERAEVSASQTGLGARWMIKSVLVVGFALLAAAALSRLIKAAVYLFGPDAARPRTGFETMAPTQPEPGLDVAAKD